MVTNSSSSLKNDELTNYSSLFDEISNPDFIFVVVTYQIKRFTEKQQKAISELGLSLAKPSPFFIDSSGEELKFPTLMDFLSSSVAVALPKQYIKGARIVFKGGGQDFPPIPLQLDD